jgi:hypothetical protein
MPRGVALDGNVADSTKKEAKAEALVSTYRKRRVSDRGFAVGAVFTTAKPRADITRTTGPARSDQH